MSNLMRAMLVMEQIEGKDAHDDPADPGGLTRAGIALNEHPELTRDGLLDMSANDILHFYDVNFWSPLGCDDMPWAWAIAVFDCAVNQGPHRAAQWVESALETREDGVIGPRDRAAMSSPLAVEDLIKFLDMRAMAYTLDAKWPNFGPSWMRRLFIVAQEGAKGS